MGLMLVGSILAEVLDAKGWSGIILVVAGIIAAISIVMRKGKPSK